MKKNKMTHFNMKKLILFIIILISFAAQAQEKDRFLPEANAQFEEKEYADAEANYRISLSKFPKKTTAAYNLGNTIYKENQTLEAGQAYLNAIENAKTRTEKHKAFHNLGNVFMKEKNYTNAVNAYKSALVNNPDDEETRYNYALAKEYLKNNPPPKDKKKDKKDDKKKDKNKEKKDDKGDKDKDKKDQGDKNKDKGKPDEKSDKTPPKPKEGGISKQRLQNLLDAVNNEEKKIQDKVNKNKVKGKPVKTEKDW
jgi:tetratricopeptide (TPR) repeat protein